MAEINYTWEFPRLECVPHESGMYNVVKIVHWRLTGDDGTYKKTSYSTVSFPSPSASDFVPYENLTKSMVEGWVTESLEASGYLQGIKDGIAQAIADQHEPSIVTPPLPWS